MKRLIAEYLDFEEFSRRSDAVHKSTRGATTAQKLKRKTLCSSLITHTLFNHDAEKTHPAFGLLGVDEVGRGPLAGPVVAAAIWLKPDFFQQFPTINNPTRITDSKQLSEKARTAIHLLAQDWKLLNWVDYQIALVDAETIDRINILEATKKAMATAIAELTPPLETPILIDGKPLKHFPYPHHALIKGDQKSLAIALASIIAKVHRDTLMKDYALKYPDYGFETHKGYGTAKHYAALKVKGCCPIHRNSFLKKD